MKKTYLQLFPSRNQTGIVIQTRSKKYKEIESSHSESLTVLVFKEGKQFTCGLQKHLTLIPLSIQELKSCIKNPALIVLSYPGTKQQFQSTGDTLLQLEPISAQSSLEQKYKYFSFVGKQLKFEGTSAEPELIFYWKNYSEKIGNMKHIRIKSEQFSFFFFYFP